MTERIALSIAEAAEAVGVHPETIRRWIVHGLHCSRIGGRVLIQPRHLRDYLDQHDESTEDLKELVAHVRNTLKEVG